jgi:ankyrin repeat protein
LHDVGRIASDRVRGDSQEGAMRVPTGLAVAALLVAALIPVEAQTPPTAAEIARYAGLHAAAAAGDVAAVEAAIARGEAVDVRDQNDRTPLHVGVFRSHAAAVRALVRAGADVRALDRQSYDIVTIAAVANDVPMLRLALALGGDARLVTSPYRGTALIAAAHLGHAEVVRLLIAAGAPLDHVNNLGWTALIESIVLGDGGAEHRACLRALLEAGANPNLADRDGRTPLALAEARGYGEMAALLRAAGGR